MVKDTWRSLIVAVLWRKRVLVDWCCSTSRERASRIRWPAMGAPVERQLAAVLSTDLVDSTCTAAATGHAIWRSMLDQYETGVNRTIELRHGSVVKHTGDGALTTFASGSEAIAAAVELRDMTRELGLDRRTGIHGAIDLVPKNVCSTPAAVIH